MWTFFVTHILFHPQHKQQDSSIFFQNLLIVSFLLFYIESNACFFSFVFFLIIFDYAIGFYWINHGFIVVGARFAILLPLDGHGGSMWLSIVVVLVILHSSHSVSACLGSLMLSQVVMLFLLVICSVQEGSYVNAITNDANHSNKNNFHIQHRNK